MSYNKEIDKYTGEIYLIINTKNNKKYVGQTTQTLGIRWNQHIYNNKKEAQPIDVAIKKYGKDNFTIEQIYYYEADDIKTLKSELDSKEKYFIKRYSSLASEWGYNIETGGTKNTHVKSLVDVYHISGELLYKSISKEEASKIYDVHIDTITKIANGAKKNLSETYVFRKENDPLNRYEYKDKHYKEIYKWSLDGTLLKKYYSRKEAINNGAVKFFADKLDDIYNTAGGYWWSTTPEFQYVGKKLHTWKKVIVYDLDGNLIRTFDSITYAAEWLKTSRNTVKDKLNNCRSNISFNGYICRYEGIPFNYGISEEDIEAEKRRLSLLETA